MTQLPPLSQARRLSIAPMMDWTDRHCRYFHRQLSRHALLYTEMITAAAIVHGDAERLLAYDVAEHPLILQLGGSEPELLARAVKIAAPYGYDGFDLNCGCPSDRVQSGAFGAVLMKSPILVAECVNAMQGASASPVSVKCRIGVDDQAPEDALPKFVETIAAAGVTDVTIHARKAWLQGLSPKENRDIPPLDYDLAAHIKARFPQLYVTLNGGITSLDMAEAALARGFDGVMIGRAAYHDAGAVLGQADARIFGAAPGPGAVGAVHAMLPYIEAQLAQGLRLNAITRHMLGAFSAIPGARQWRRILSEGAHKPGAGPELVERALAEITRLAA